MLQIHDEAVFEDSEGLFSLSLMGLYEHFGLVLVALLGVFIHIW